MPKSANLKIQKWGNSLAVRIPSSVARQAGFQVGQPVLMSIQDSAVLVSPTGLPTPTLAQRRALFAPGVHGGEAMASHPVGREVL